MSGQVDLGGRDASNIAQSDRRWQAEHLHSGQATQGSRVVMKIDCLPSAACLRIVFSFEKRKEMQKENEATLW